MNGRAGGREGGLLTWNNGHDESEAPDEDEANFGRLLVEFRVAERRRDEQEALHRHERQEEQGHLQQTAVMQKKSNNMFRVIYTSAERGRERLKRYENRLGKVESRLGIYIYRFYTE